MMVLSDIRVMDTQYWHSLAGEMIDYLSCYSAVNIH